MIPPLSAAPQAVKLFAAVCILFEAAALVGLATGMGPDVRRFLLLFGGFWPDLLKGAAPIFDGQGILMFASSAVLHGGPLHLFMNMIGLLWLGPLVVQRVGAAAFWPILGLSALGSGCLFALITNSGMPMVGASGVIFGLLGAVATWEVMDRVNRRASLRSLLQPAAVFLGLNLFLTLSAGNVAWEAHLGGFLAGGLCGVLSWRGPFSARWS